MSHVRKPDTPPHRADAGRRDAQKTDHWKDARARENAHGWPIRRAGQHAVGGTAGATAGGNTQAGTSSSARDVEERSDAAGKGTASAPGPRRISSLPPELYCSLLSAGRLTNPVTNSGLGLG